MTSFIIGTVIEPEVKEITVKATGAKRKVANFGLLSGKTCNSFDIFDDSKVFAKVSALKEGEQILAIVGTSVDKQGQLRSYLNGVGVCPDALRNQLLSLVKQ